MIAAGADFAIPLGALIVSGGALLVTARTIRSKAGADYVSSLERRLDEHERRLLACEAQRDELASENVRLMRELFRGKGGE